MELSKDNVELLAGESEKISATVLPESLGMGVTWSVEDTSYVSCTDGVIAAKKEGVTYVIATSADGYAKASCMVTVNPVAYAVTITNEAGVPLQNVYGYPGMAMKLKAITADGKTHTLTWSVDDESVASIDNEGNLILKEVTSENPNYVFLAESYIKVRTEDGCGYKIPVRSSLSKGVMVGENFMTLMPITIEKESAYRISLLYDESSERLAEIPVDDIELSLSDSENFTIEKEELAYKLTTGTQMGKTTKLSVKTKGAEQSVEIAVFKVDITLTITAELKGATTCTLGFTWTEGKSADDDVSKAYTIALFSDSMCENKVISLDIPANSECFEGKQPCFVFGGLESGKTYFFRANETGDEERISNVVEATTGEFTNVAYNEVENPVIGDIILAENFNEWGYGTDETMGAAGFYDNNANLTVYSGDVDMNTVSLQKPSSTGRRFFHQTNLWDTGARIAQWGFAGNSSSYLRAGYLRMTTTSSGNRTHLVTPKLESIPVGCVATIEVTARIFRPDSGNDFGVLVQTGTMSKNSSTSNPLPCYKLGTLATDKKYPFEMTKTGEWETHSVTIEGVTSSNSLAFGSIENVDTKNRFFIGEITVKVTDIKSASGLSASFVAKSSSTLVFSWTKGSGVDADVADAYTVKLYSDSSCSTEIRSFDIPAGSKAWQSKAPKFVLSGLTPSTDYWFKVIDTTMGIESNVVKATTEAFTIVQMPAEITETGVVLAEDFGELCWDFDYPNDAMGYYPAEPRTSFGQSAVDTGKTNEGNKFYNGYHRSGGGETNIFSGYSTAFANSRLNDWYAEDNIYVHPGYLKFGTSSGGGWLHTPAFTVPEGKKAVITVTITAGRYDSGQESEWAIGVEDTEHFTPNSGNHTCSSSWQDTSDSACYQLIEFTNNNTWVTKSVSGLVIHKGDRLIIGAKSGATSNKRRFQLSDVTVTVTSIEDE